MDKISYKGKAFSYYEYANEKSFEKDVIEHTEEIFGPKSVYDGSFKKLILKKSFL